MSSCSIDIINFCPLPPKKNFNPHLTGPVQAAFTWPLQGLLSIVDWVRVLANYIIPLKIHLFVYSILYHKLSTGTGEFVAGEFVAAISAHGKLVVGFDVLRSINRD